jgi:folate-binding Fe-S cluster repair protein YgfZ
MNEPFQNIDAAPLPFLGVLRIGGADATGFLQGQVTSDLRLLEDGRTQLAACNTPQGRVIALLRLKKADDAIYALLPADLLDKVYTLLRRFVLRSKVDLQIASGLQVASVATLPSLPDTASARLVAFEHPPGRRVIAASADAWRSITGSGLPDALPGRLD